MSAENASKLMGILSEATLVTGYEPYYESKSASGLTIAMISDNAIQPKPVPVIEAAPEPAPTEAKPFEVTCAAAPAE